MSNDSVTEELQAGKSTKRQFDFSKHPKRRIALMFLYFGWEYNGLVEQRDVTNTVEEHMKAALLKTKLIESWENCGWNRSGRTDKGVSAFKQVASLFVRSNDHISPGGIWSGPECKPLEAKCRNNDELPYDKMLNAVLPQSIRILAWSPVTEDFSARYCCDGRTYTYAFPACNYDVSALQEACRLLVGKHDFRNFCRIDMNKNRVEMSYVREITHAEIVPLFEQQCSNIIPQSSPYDFLLFTVKSTGFLWHQIRCIVAVLHEIGCGNEKPEVISELLDIKATPSKPAYGLATASPLCLFDCSYNAEFKWQWNISALRAVRGNLLKKWAEMQALSCVLRSMAEGLGELIPELKSDYSGLNCFLQSTGPVTKNYVKLKDRPKCDSLEYKKEKMRAKRARHS